MSRKHILYHLPLVLISLPQAVSAQTAGQAAPQAASDELEDIVVTARRKEESTLDVPLSVTAVSGEALARANITSLADLGRIAPAVRTAPVAGRVSSTAFFIRGLGEATGSVSADPATGIYFADAIQTRPQGVGRALYDLSSVQILHGPQGTLFGRNLTGGAVLITPAPATIGELGGYAKIGVGNYSERTAQGALNIPLGDIVAVRASGSLVRHDPYTTNVVTQRGRADEHSDSARVTINVEPSSTFSNALVVDYFKGRSRGLNIIPTNMNPAVDTATSPYDIRLIWLARQKAAGVRSLVDGVDGPYSTASNLGFTNTSRVELNDAITLKNIFNYRRIRSYDQQATAIPATDTTPLYPLVDITNIVRSRQYSNEIQVMGSLFDGLEYTAGAYFFWERAHQQSYTSSLGGVARQILPIATNESKSLFAQVNFEALPNLTLTAGGRYTWDERSLYHRVITPAGVTAVNQFVNKSFGKFTYTLAANYKPTENSLIYVTTRRGYRSGGFNASATSAAALAPVDPEVLTDYEIGAKYQQRNFRVSASLFHSSYDEIQRSLLTIVGTPPAPTQLLLNAAEATVKGGEFEIAVRPVNIIELSGFVSYVDTKYKSFKDPISGANLTHLPFSQTPKWTYRLAADLRLPTPEEIGQLRVSADYSYQSKILGGEASVIHPGYMLPGRGLLNGRISIDQVANTPLSVAVFGRNITNKDYFTAIAPLYDAPFGVTRSVVGDPRTWGVELSVKF